MWKAIKSCHLVFIGMLFIGNPHNLYASKNNRKITGLSQIHHYTKDEIGVDAQFWSMAEDENGVLYFGNNKGVSVYNGYQWSLVSLPNNSAVKAVKQVFDGRIFVGGSNEFGTIEKDNYGNFYYKSMMGILNENDRKIDEVWQIISFEHKILIRSFSSIVILNDNKVTILPTENSFNYVNYLAGYLYVFDDMGISRLDPNSLELNLIFKRDQFNSEYIISLLPSPINYELIGFSRQGNSFIFNLKTNSVKKDKRILASNLEDQIFCAAAEDLHQFYIGTVHHQIIKYNYKTKIVNEWRSDLQDKTVLNIFKSKDGSIWAMLNKGMDCIETVFPGSLVFGGASVYDAVIHNNIYYIATNQGVYAAKIGSSGALSTPQFEIVENLSAQAWNVSVHDSQVFVGHDKGAYIINGFKSKKIDGTNGIWKVIGVKGNKSLLLACGYDGIYVLEKKGPEYQVRNKIENFDTSSRDILQANDEGVYWICHGYEGVYNIKINSEYTKVVAREHFTDKNGLPSQYNINVTRYNDEIIFLSKFGFYQFNAESNRFIELVHLNNIFKDNLDVSKIVQAENRTWFVQNEQLGYFDKNADDGLHKSVFASLNGSFITSMEYLEPLSDHNILVGTSEGVYSFNLSQDSIPHTIPTIFSSISYKLGNDSLIYADITNNQLLKVPYRMKSLKFNFGAPGLTPKKDVQFSFMLEKFDNGWSPWSNEQTKDYSYLPPGEYTFKVKGRSIIGHQSDLAEFNFIVLPVWYQTRPVQFAFVVIVLLLIFISYRIVSSRLKSAKRENVKIRMAYEAELEAVKLQKEKELIERDNQRLAEDIVNKSKEITNYTLLLSKKHDLLEDISKEINEIKKNAKLDKTKNNLRSIVQKIRMNLLDEEHLQIFDTNFERVHQEFFQELKSRYPDLHHKELRLCGLVKMNMTNKEIASILNISARGVETAKYRLRKRVGIENDVSLTSFFDQMLPNNAKQ